MRIIEISKVTQEGSELCWAAAVEMVYQHYTTKSHTDIFQSRLIELKNGWVRAYNSGTPPPRPPLLIKNSMEDKKDYYLRLLNSSLLDAIGCTQYQITSFIDRDFIEKQIEHEQAIIFSNVAYPTLNGSAHVILVSGYHVHKSKDKDIFWILGLNPLNMNDGTFKYAWTHAFFKQYQASTRTYDFVTNFAKGNSRLTTSIATTSDYGSTYPQQVFASIESFVREIISKNCSMLSAFFGFDCKSSFELNRHYYYRSILAQQVLNNDWSTQPNSRWRLLYLPVYQADDFIFEMIFQERNEDKATLLGIEEAKGIQNIPKLKAKSNGVVHQLDHKKPNYSILCITPLNLLFYEIDYDNEILLAPLNDYNPALQKAILYTQTEIITAIKSF